MIDDDHSAFVQALELVLGQVEGAEVALARTLEEGTELIAEIKQSLPETPVAVLSAREDVDEAASNAGAAIPKDTSLPDIISSLKRLAE
jgi:DNA-binding NtrC family response regulator